jgi:GNAT superfamily N-acetyltransferase
MSVDHTLTIHSYTGDAIHPFLHDMAHLRMEVFREWPYLYDGDHAYEQRYLHKYISTPDALVVVATIQDKVVGVSTGLPLHFAESALQAPFHAHHENVSQWFYFGESVLLSDFRGHGIGKAFFDAREQHARERGYHHICFCAVEREQTHPLRPADYHSLDGLWTKRGFAKQPHLQATLGWLDIDQPHDTDKTLTFWTCTTP